VKLERILWLEELIGNAGDGKLANARITEPRKVVELL
jgi:hypothetical protein